MALAHAPEHQLALVEHRLVHAAVQDVAAHHHGVVVVNDVTLVDVIAKVVGHSLHGRHQAAQVDRNVLALDDHLGAVVEQRVAVVVRHVEDAGACRLLQRQGHFALGGFQCASNHGQRDRVYLASGIAHRLSPVGPIETIDEVHGAKIDLLCVIGLRLRAQAFALACTLG